MPVRDPRIWVPLGALLVVAVAAGVTLLRTTDRFARATATLSVISGQVNVVTGTATPRSATHGEELVARMTVRPQAPDGRAVLTFRDGSTIELEPEASVTIEELSLGTRGELVVRLHQDRGKTWSHVQPQLSPNSRFHIRTPSGTAVVRGTSFDLDVTNASAASVTKVTVFQGRVDLVADGAVVPLAASYSTEVAAGSEPLPARRISTSDLCMRIEVSSEALITVTDPHGRSAGVTPKGVLSQIPRTIVTGPQDDPQAIEVFSPTAGSWEIGIVPRDDGGPLQLLAYTVVDGQVIDKRALTMTIDRFQRVVTSLRLDADGRSGSFAPPVESTATRAVALPSDNTTTAPLPQARLFPPRDDPLALACVPAEELEGRDGVQPVPSPEQTSGR